MNQLNVIRQRSLEFSICPETNRQGVQSLTFYKKLHNIHLELDVLIDLADIDTNTILRLIYNIKYKNVTINKVLANI